MHPGGGVAGAFVVSGLIAGFLYRRRKQHKKEEMQEMKEGFTDLPMIAPQTEFKNCVIPYSQIKIRRQIGELREERRPE